MPLTAAPAEVTTPATPDASTRSSFRTLVVDDNVDAAESLTMFVMALGGECRTAHDGERAIREAREFRPHVVLLDLGMPRMDGFETCRRLRQALGPDLTVIALSGWVQALERHAAIRAGFDMHLEKPFDPSVLKQLLTSLRSGP